MMSNNSSGNYAQVNLINISSSPALAAAVIPFLDELIPKKALTL
jgi:hypothetical protein